MFECNQNSGFKMTFANGWTVSVQFSHFNYCANRDTGPNSTDDQRHALSYNCVDAEIAAWDRNNTWFNFDHGDTVHGRQTPDQVAAFIAKVAAF